MNMIGGGAGRGPRASIDEFNEALVIQDEVHYNIHRGIFFTATHLVTTLGTGTSSQVLLETSGVVHMRATLASSAQVTVRLFEDTVISASGTQLALYNRNRLSAIASGSTAVFANPTVTSDGALLFAGFAPGGAKNDAVGSQSSTFHEWILRPNSLYLFRISNDSGGDAAFSLEVDVYEPGLAT